MYRYSFRDATQQNSLNTSPSVQANDVQDCSPILCLFKDFSFGKASQNQCGRL